MNETKLFLPNNMNIINKHTEPYPILKTRQEDRWKRVKSIVIQFFPSDIADIIVDHAVISEERDEIDTIDILIYERIWPMYEIVNQSWPKASWKARDVHRERYYDIKQQVSKIKRMELDYLKENTFSKRRLVLQDLQDEYKIMQILFERLIKGKNYLFLLNDC